MNENNQRIHMLKEVYSTHTIIPCHKICITENCKMKNKCLVARVVGRLRKKKKVEKSVYTSLCATFYFSNVCGHDRSTLLFIFYAKYSVEKTWASPCPLVPPCSLCLSQHPLFGKMFNVSYTCCWFSFLLKCKACTNLNLFCGQIVWFRSFQRSRKRHHTYFLCIVWIYFDFLLQLFLHVLNEFLPVWTVEIFMIFFSCFILVFIMNNSPIFSMESARGYKL